MNLNFSNKTNPDIVCYSFNLGTSYNTKYISFNYNTPIKLLFLGTLLSIGILIEKILLSIFSIINKVRNFVISHATINSSSKNTSSVSNEPSGVKKQSSRSRKNNNSNTVGNNDQGGGGKKNPNISMTKVKAYIPRMLRRILRELYLLRALLSYIIVEENNMSIQAQQAIFNINFGTSLPHLSRHTQPGSIFGSYHTDFLIFFHDLSLTTLGEVEIFHNDVISPMIGHLEDLLQPLDPDFESSDEDIDDMLEVFQHFGLDPNIFNL